MDRRSFLLGAFAVAVASPALAATAADDPAAMKQLTDGWSTARAAGRPLLVLVIPASDEDKWRRGRIFGEWINHGDDDAKALLGSVTWVCATADQVRAFAPGVDIRGEPWMILLDPSKVPTRGRAIDVDPGPDPQGWGEDADSHEEDRRIDHHIAVQTAALDAALGAWGLGLADLTAPTRSDAIARATATATADPSGAYWATSHGCGLMIEGIEDQMGVKCGMGYTPERSARFLYFYADPRY
jgi:hypothetical protein